MKKNIIVGILALISVFCFFGSSLATQIGELEDNLRICSYEGCVRPILIYSIENKIDVYITGEIVKSARLISKRVISKSNRPEEQDFFYFEGGLYFDFKDKASKETAINKIKTMIRIHDENRKLNTEMGKPIPSPESEDSYFWGSLIDGHYVWGYSGPRSSDVEKIDNFRFLTMRIIATFPISRDDLSSYDTASSTLLINRRCFHSGKPIKININDKPFIGLVDPRSSMSLSSGVGAILLNSTPDRYHLKAQNTPKDILIFKDIIEAITVQIFKTRDTFQAPKRSTGYKHQPTKRPAQESNKAEEVAPQSNTPTKTLFKAIDDLL